MKKISVFLLVLFSWISVHAQQNPVVASQPYKFMKWVSIADSLILNNPKLGTYTGHLTFKPNGTVGLDTVKYATGTITFSTDFTYISSIVGMNFDTMFNQKQNFYFKQNGFTAKFDSVQILNAPVNGNNPLRLKDSGLFQRTILANEGLTKVGNTVKLGGFQGQLTGDRTIFIGNNVFDFSGGDTSDSLTAVFTKDYVVLTNGDNSGNGAALLISSNSGDPIAQISIAQGSFTAIKLTTSGIPVRDDFGAGMGYHDNYIIGGKSTYGGNWISSARYVDSTAKFKADSVKGTITGGGTVTSVSSGYGMDFTAITSTGAVKADSTVLQTVLNFFPKGDTRYYTKTISDGKYALLATTISPGTGLTGGGSLAANRTLSADTTVLQTILNFFPKGDTRYAKITSLPTGATPTASIGFTAVAGSATSFTRSDGAAKADSTVIRSVANSYSLAGMQTKLNNYALLASPTFTGTPLAPTASFGTNTTQIATTAFVQAAIPSLTGFVPYTGATTDVVLGAHNITAQSEILTGTGGAGIIDMVSQSASPASTSGHLKIYPDSLNRFSYKNSIYRRTFQVPYPSDYTARFPYKVTGTTLEDSTFSATTYAFQSTAINNGYAITGGGNLSASRTLAVDSTLQASKTWAFAAFNTKAQDASTYVPLSRTVNGKALSSNITLGLASSDFANQGTTTTVLHGNASGNPAFSAVSLTADVSNILPIANGGTNSATQNWVDLTTTQASIAGNKTLTGITTLSPTTTGTSIGTLFTPSVTATANSQGLIGKKTTGTFADGGFTSVVHIIENWAWDSANMNVYNATGAADVDVNFTSNPSSTNYGIRGNGTTTIFNAPTTGGAVRFRVNNSDQYTIVAVSGVVTHTWGSVMSLSSAGVLNLPTVGSELKIAEGSGGFVGQTTLVTGTKAITITGVTTSSRALVQLVTPSGVTLTTTYQAVCTANTLTIQANVAAGTINTADGSTLNYFIFN